MQHRRNITERRIKQGESIWRITKGGRSRAGFGTFEGRNGPCWMYKLHIPIAHCKLQIMINTIKPTNTTNNENGEWTRGVQNNCSSEERFNYTNTQCNVKIMDSSWLKTHL